MDISIIVPVFNEEAFLEESLSALVAQTYPVKEIVVVDDGSTDSSMVIAKKYAEKYPFVHLVLSNDSSQHQPGQKVIYAFERGFAQLKNPFDVICKFDADIIFPKNYIATLVQSFSKNPTLGMFGGVVQIKKNGSWEFEAISSKTHLRGPIKAYRKSCFEAIGGLRPALGWDTLDELLAMYHGFDVIIDKDLCVKHLKPTGASYNSNFSKAKGQMFYSLGYGLVLGLLACAKWAYKQNGSWTGTLLGFLGSWLFNKPKLVTKSEAKFIRNNRWLQIRKRFIS